MILRCKDTKSLKTSGRTKSARIFYVFLVKKGDRRDHFAALAAQKSAG